MDFAPAGFYPVSMFSRLVAMLAITVLAAMSAATPAHAARLGAEPDHAIHVSEMMQVADCNQAPCHGEKHRSPIDPGGCELLCTGLSALLAPVAEGTGRDVLRNRHALPLGTTGAGQTPALNEPPPKPRLL
ncbi:hypothetical protein GCM10017635_19070 [Paracoccus kondratievae]|uniref:Uncharacterized protein n=2 Tax=Paracoccus kondratievae TaxID=135740 RepID=A0AAD3NXI8_9RHOB|nr:hypothetical protein GCM10017635_19070 [Paracoccus kondratievae]